MTRRFARLNRDRKKHGITLVQIGDACNPPVTNTTVSLVLRGLRPSESNVIPTTERLIQEADAKHAATESTA